MEIKVSQLPVAGTPDDTDIYMVVQVGDVDPNRKQTLAELRTALGVVSANLAALNSLTGAANRIPYFTGPGAMALAVFTAYGRNLVEAADAAAARTLLSVQPTANPVFTGGAKAEQLVVSATASSPALTRALRMQTLGLDRFNFVIDGTESTGNAGSDLLITRNSDLGVFLGRVISATRSSGNVSVGNAAPDTVAQLLVNGPLWATGPVKPGQYTLTTLPSAATYNGYEIDVTNATGGSKRCRSDGSVWQILNTTTTVS